MAYKFIQTISQNHDFSSLQITTTLKPTNLQPIILSLALVICITKRLTTILSKMLAQALLDFYYLKL